MESSEPYLDREILGDYVDGELDAATQFELARYLAQHPGEAARVEAYRNQNEVLQRMVERITSGPVPERLRQVIEQGGPPAAEMPARRGWRMAAVSLATAAAVVLSAYVGWFVRSGMMQRAAQARSEAAFVQQAVNAYSLYAQAAGGGFDNIQNSDLSKFADWFKKNLGAAVVLPRLDAGKYKVLAARILPSSGGAAGQIVFKSQSDGHTLAWYFRVSPATNSSGRAVAVANHQEVNSHAQVRSVGQYSVYYWRFGHTSYALISSDKKQTPDDFLKKASKAPSLVKHS